MKSFVKYPLAFSILLLVAYAHVFAPLIRANSSLSRKIQNSKSIAPVQNGAAGIEEVYFEEDEEEDKRSAVKKQLALIFDFSFSYNGANLLQQQVYYPISQRLAFSDPQYLMLRTFRL